MSHLKLLTRSYQKGCICVLKIKVKYFDDELKRIQKISIGDWIDLRAAQDVTLKKGDVVNIPLGVAMELPEGYEAWLISA